jgi:hypothetical protein
VAGAKWITVAGVVLVVAGVIGFLTVADDLRHEGEATGVASLLLAGIVLLASGRPAARGLALYWVAVGIGIGMVAGAAFDHMLAGVGGGAALGAVKMALSRTPH